MPPLTKLATWNLWLIPNSSSELGPRPIKQAQRLARLMRPPSPEADEMKSNANNHARQDPSAAAAAGAGLRVVVMQEVWAWHCGCAKPLFSCTVWPLPLDLRIRLRRVSPQMDVLCDALVGLVSF